MITVDMILAGNPRLDEAAAQYLADLWNTAYPHMRAHLTDVIEGCRVSLDPQRRAERAERLGLRRNIEPDQQSLDRCARELRHYEAVRRELGQLDRGAHRGCGRMTPSFRLSSANENVRYTLAVLPIDSPHAGDIYRLAAELCDQTNAWRAAIKAEIAHAKHES